MYDEWNAEFKRVGRGPIEAEALAYFRKEFGEIGDEAIQLDTIVFHKKPENRQLVIFNKMAVKVFLSHNWEYMRKLYPCLPSFVNVIGDADLMYTVSYPWTHIDTHEIHGVETVREFVDFAQALIRKTCMDHQENGAKPVSATTLSLSSTGSVPFSTGPMQNMMSTGRLDNQGVVLNAKAKKFRDDDEQSKAMAERKHMKYVTVNLESDRPPIQAYIDAQNELEMLRRHGIEPTDATLWNMFSNILQYGGVTLHGKIHDGEPNPFEFLWAHFGNEVFKGGIEEKDWANNFVNMALARVKKDGTLDSISGIVEDNSYGKYPSTFRIEGDIGSDGKITTKTVVYTVGDKVVPLDFKRVYDHLRSHTRMGVHSLWNHNLGLNLREEFTEAEKTELAKVRGMLINFSDPTSNEDEGLEQAYAVVNALFGEGTDFLSEKDVVVAVFLNTVEVEANPGMKTGVQDFFSTLISTKARLRQTHGEHRAEILLNQLNEMLQIRNESRGDGDGGSCGVGNEESNTCLTTGVQPSTTALKQLQDRAFNTLEEILAGPLFEAIDDYAVLKVDGWREFKQARDSVSPKERENAKAAVAAAYALRHDGIFPDILFAGMQRSVQHGGSSYFPLGITNLWNLFASVGKSMPEDNVKQFFYGNLSAELLRKHAKEIAGTTMADIDSWCNDVALLYDVEIGRWQKKALHRNEADMVLHTLVYCLTGALFALYRYLKSDSPDEHRYRALGSHLFMLVIGISTHVPMTVVHLLLVILIKAVITPLDNVVGFTGWSAIQIASRAATLIVSIAQRFRDKIWGPPPPPEVIDPPLPLPLAVTDIINEASGEEQKEEVTPNNAEKVPVNDNEASGGEQKERKRVNKKNQEVVSLLDSDDGVRTRSRNNRRF